MNPTIIKYPMAVFLMTFVLAVYSFQVSAQGQEPKLDGKNIYVKIKVDGLACSFCAYGLEKKLKKHQNAKDIEVDLQKGVATFRVSGSRKPDEQELEALVIDAGFTPRKVEYSNKPFSDDESNQN